MVVERVDVLQDDLRERHLSTDGRQLALFDDVIASNQSSSRDAATRRPKRIGHIIGQLCSIRFLVREPADKEFDGIGKPALAAHYSWP